MSFLKGSPEKSTSGSAQTWAKPYATEGAQDVLNVYNAAQPGLQAVQGNVMGQLGNLGTTGQGLAKQTAAFGQTAGKANGFYGDVIGGQYMSGNPYIKNILGQLDQSITDQVGSQFENGGRYGSGAYVGTLANQLGNANSQVLYGNYSDEMNRRMQASQQADSALAQQQQAQSANSQQQLAAAQLASQVPYTGINALGNSLGALFNGGTSQGKTPGLLDYLAQGASAAASAYSASDRRLKKDIVRVGALEDGLGVYEWAYKHDPSNTRCRGVMADEVKELRPQAYIENYRDGYAGVNYAAL
jgi:hypothetical protein